MFLTQPYIIIPLTKRQEHSLLKPQDILKRKSHKLLFSIKNIVSLKSTEK